MTLLTKVNRYRSRATDSGGLGYASFILLLLIVAYWFVQPHVFTSGAQLDSFISEGVVVALAAMGTAVVIITGEFDLSVGSALTLVNVVVVTRVGESMFSQTSVVVLALMTGILVGGLNGVLIAYLKIPSIVATLATLFLWSGVALLILHQPGGRMPDRYVLWFTGYSGFLPTAVVIVGGAVLGWLIIARSVLGRRIFALGGNAEAAHANGINIKRTKLLAFVIAGAFYGLSGAVLTAQSASGDPNIGDTLVLTVYAALVVGGMPLGGGREARSVA